MNRTSLTNTVNLSGFYELDAQGIVLYSRIKSNGKSDTAAETVIGKDFFAEVLDCQNSNVLRRRFLTFVSGKFTTETFIFGCEMSGVVTPMRVMLVRISDVNRPGRGALFYIDIKPD